MDGWMDGWTDRQRGTSFHASDSVNTDRRERNKHPP